MTTTPTASPTTMTTTPTASPTTMTTPPTTMTTTPTASPTTMTTTSTTTTTTSTTTTAPPTNTTAPPTTTTTRATTTTTPAPTAPSTTLLSFSLSQSFTEELNDPNSPVYQALERNVTSKVDEVFREKRGFRKSRVKDFKRGSVIANMALDFDPGTGTNTTDIALTFITAASSPTFGLPVNTSRVSVASPPTTTPTTTTPTTTTAPPTTTTAPPTATTAPPTAITASPPTTTSTTASTNPPSGNEAIIFLQFALDQNFTQGLTYPSTEEYRALASKCRGELNRIGKNGFKNSFSRALISAFASGSVKVNSTLIFQNENLRPEVGTTLNVFRTELLRSTVLPNVIRGSVDAQSSGRSLHRSVLPMSILTIILLFFTQILADV
ncbi:integumentary mucin C.1-like isoform X2 [Boleophthalmus pectinirostris]|uniref:integumentary mucin C.1-like isoform X2 n=1 Tax=Boleophthalmus pectinirostris TaxID=150288 RepID=UPI00242E1FBC|nr:integumentary mucin C.1-like isoform X2 [Boleophthalmus pectinirostris]